MIFVSTSVYSLAKELGAGDAVAEVHRQLEECARTVQLTDAVRSDTLPAVRVIARLRLLDELALHIDAGATCIGKARSRAFHRFRESAADLWVSVDDDNDATTQTLRWLVEAVSDEQAARVCLAPYLLRGPRQESTLSVQLPQIYVPRQLSNGGAVRNATAGGFGLVAMNRQAATALAARDDAASLAWRDDDGTIKIAAFYDELSDGKWYGEDLSFFRRLPRHVQVEALATGHTSHAGEVLELGSVLELLGA